MEIDRFGLRGLLKMNTLEGNTSQSNIAAAFTLSLKNGWVLHWPVLHSKGVHPGPSVIDKVISEVCRCGLIHVMHTCAKSPVEKSHYCKNKSLKKKEKKKRHYGLWVVPRLWFQMQTQLSADTCSRKTGVPCGIPSRRCRTEMCTNRDYCPKNHGRRGASGWASGGKGGRLRWAFFGAEFLGAVIFFFVFFKRTRGCIHPSTGSPVSQAPKEAFSAEETVDGGNGAPRTLIMEGVSWYSQICFSGLQYV